MDSTILFQQLLQSWPNVKLTNQKKSISMVLPLNKLVELDLAFMWFETNTGKFFCKSPYHLKCKTVELIVQAIRLNTSIADAKKLATLYYQSFRDDLSAIDLNAPIGMQEWLKAHKAFIQKTKEEHATESASLNILYKTLKPFEAHLENIPVAGHYQFRMLAGIVLAMLIDRDYVLTLIKNWRKVVVSSFDIDFLDRAEYLFAHYNSDDLNDRPEQIYYEMSKQFGNPYLVAPKKLNLLKEVEITASGTYLQVIFNSTPPLGGIDDVYWDNFEQLIAKDLDVKVTR
jgi:hypothetical protein